MLGTVTAHFQVDAVLMAVGICAAITFALTIFAFQTKYDFTTCGGEKRECSFMSRDTQKF